MEKKEKRKIDMSRVSIFYCNGIPAAIIGSMAKFPVILQRAKDKIVLIDGYSIVADPPDKGKGITVNADLIRDTVSKMALACAGSLVVFANEPGALKPALSSEMDLVISDFTGRTKEACLTLVGSVKARLLEFQAPLVAGGYGTDDTDITTLTAGHTLYGVAIGSTQTGKVTRKQAREQRANLVHDLIESDFKKGLDLLLRTLIIKNKPIYDGYLLARNIINTATVHTGLYVDVKYLPDNLPLEGVEGTITKVGGNFTQTLFSDAAGKLHFEGEDGQGIEIGFYNVGLRMLHFENVEQQNIEVKLGTRKSHLLNMEPKGGVVRPPFNMGGNSEVLIMDLEDVGLNVNSVLNINNLGADSLFVFLTDDLEGHYPNDETGKIPANTQFTGALNGFPIMKRYLKAATLSAIPGNFTVRIVAINEE